MLITSYNTLHIVFSPQGWYLFGNYIYEWFLKQKIVYFHVKKREAFALNTDVNRQNYFG